MTMLQKTLFACLLTLILGVANAEPLDINSADATTIAATISGIGPARAEAIVVFRNENGPFGSVDDLVLVKGIGMATIDKNRDKLKVVKR
ncbi:MAG: ComEA family DNA-binding protein [Gammaproteobacteria bacterium]|jgi:competence protein ComEA